MSKDKFVLKYKPNFEVPADNGEPPKFEVNAPSENEEFEDDENDD